MLFMLEENEEGGESRLKFKTKSSNTMTIENIDKKHREVFMVRSGFQFAKIHILERVTLLQIINLILI